MTVEETTTIPAEWRTSIHHFLPWYPERDDDEETFINSTVKKQEYWAPLETSERHTKVLVHEQPYFAHQILIARFLSRWTLYSNLYVIHEMGTGKTHVALACIDTLKQQNPEYKVIFLAPSQTIIQNFLQLFHVSSTTFHRFLQEFDRKKTVPVPEIDVSTGQEQTEDIRIRWASRHKGYGLQTYTYETFAKFVASLSNEQLEKTFSSVLVICDECHHLNQERAVDERALPHRGGRVRMINPLMGWTKGRIYKELHRFFHLPLMDRKTLFMTGTPIRDQIYEISSILNLLFPLNEQVPTGRQFLQQYFQQVTTTPDIDTKVPVFQWKATAEKELASRLQGYISVFRQRLPDVTLEYQGQILDPMKYWKLHLDPMSEFQSYWYEEAWRKSRHARGQVQQQQVGQEQEIQSSGGETDTLYKEAVQASLMVFPMVKRLDNGDEEEEGIWGEKVFQHFLQIRHHHLSWKPHAPWPRDVIQLLRSPTEAYTTKIEQLAQYSTIYASLLDSIIHNPQQVTYVYCSAVTGSGILALGAMLQTFFGYTLLTRASQLQSPDMRQPKKRCLLLNTLLGLRDQEIQSLLAYVNHPRNAEGEYCQLVLSTDKTKEGISLFHVQQIHILTPSWNMADISQAIARGIRQGSHDELRRRGVSPLRISIFLHCAVPTDPPNQQQQQPPKLLLKKSIDFERYFRSERKDQNMQLMMRLFMQCAWDCVFWKDRHQLSSHFDYSRECQYDKCSYDCFGQRSSHPPSFASREYDTFDLYYSTPDLDLIQEHMITCIQQSSFSVPVATVLEYVETHLQRRLRPIEWTRVLAHILQQPLQTPWGRIGYIVYTNDCLSWTDNPVFVSQSHNTSNTYVNYVKYPSSLLSHDFDSSALNEWNPTWRVNLSVIQTLIDRLVKSVPHERLTDTTIVLTPSLSDSYSESIWNAIIRRLLCLPSSVLFTYVERTLSILLRSTVTDRQVETWFWIFSLASAFPSGFQYSPNNAKRLTEITTIRHQFPKDVSSSPQVRVAMKPEWTFQVHTGQTVTPTTTTTTTTSVIRRTRPSRTSYELSETEKTQFIFENPVGYYGILEPRGDFLIRHVENHNLFRTQQSKLSRKDIPTGKICNNFQVPELYKIVFRLWSLFPNIFDLDVWYKDPLFQSTLRSYLLWTPQKVHTELDKSKSFRTFLDALPTSKDKEFVQRHFRSFFYLTKLPKHSLLCQYIQSSFQKVNLLYFVPNS